MADQKEQGVDDQEGSKTPKGYPGFIRQLILPDTQVQQKGFVDLLISDSEFLKSLGLKDEGDYKSLLFFLGGAALWWLIALGFGVYLSVLLAPLIFSTLLALSIAPWLAFFLGAMAILSLILGTALLLSPPMGLLNQLALEWMRHQQYVIAYSGQHEPSLLNSRHQRFNSFLSWFYVLGLLAGIGLGIYLSTLMIPFLITALAATLSHGMAVFVGIVAGLVLTLATAYLLVQPVLVVSGLRDIVRTVFKFIGRQDYFLNTLYLGSLMLGAGLGIYASLVVAPFLISTLLALSLSPGIAFFTTIALSLALVSLASWLSSLVITDLALLVISPFQSKPLKAKDPLLATGGKKSDEVVSASSLFERSSLAIATLVSFPSYGQVMLSDYPEEVSNSGLTSK